LDQQGSPPKLGVVDASIPPHHHQTDPVHLVVDDADPRSLQSLPNASFTDHEGVGAVQSLPAKHGRGGNAGGQDLLGARFHPGGGQLLDDLLGGSSRVVGDELERNPSVPDGTEGVGGPGYSLVASVDHAVQVDQEGVVVVDHRPERVGGHASIRASAS
jgi:hypothetical protein